VTALYPVLEAVLEQSGFELERRPDRGLLIFPVTGDNGAWTTVAQAREEQRQAFFYSVAPELVPEATRDEAARLMSRINWGLALGTFELDLDDGQVRFRTSLDVGEADLTPALVKPLLIANFTLMDRYLPAVLAVASGISAAEALARDVR